LPKPDLAFGFDRGAHVILLADRDAAGGDDQIMLGCGRAQHAPRFVE
jgi:hypothetical protein